MEKIFFSIGGVRTIQHTWTKYLLNVISHFIQKINSELIIHLNVQCETHKYVEENLHDLGLYKELEFLDMMPKA